jgi:hypothetical protein
MFCVLSTKKSAEDPSSGLRTALDAWAPDVVRVYVLQAADDCEQLVTLAWVESDPGQGEEGEQVFRVVEDVRVREWRAGRAAVAAGMI